jgi:heme exporter protein CcmD
MSWADFQAMGDRAFYLWGSFGAFFLMISVEIIWLRIAAKRVSNGTENEMESEGERK